MEESTQHLLNEEDFYRSALAPTTRGKRFANYLIDLLSFYLFLFVGGGVIGIIWAVFDQVAMESFFNSLDNTPPLIDRVVTALLYGLYMSVIESLFRGKSLGKLITKTRAIAYDGSKPTISQFFIRGFSRAVPFNGFSFLGSDNPEGWHDRWSDTMVVDDTMLPSGNFLNPEN